MQPIAAPTRPSANDPGGSIAPRAELIERFDVAGPRYTSYPTADRFVEAFDASNLDQWLRQRASLGWRQPLSVYVHVPFCASVCYYCACNKIVTKDHARGRPYVDDLLREVELYGERLGRREPVSQLHFGGGTPTFLDGATLQAAIDGLERVFTFPENAERSIEVDPRTVDVARLRELHDQRLDRKSVV